RSAYDLGEQLDGAQLRLVRGCDLPRDVREVSDRSLRGARGMEDRLVGVQERIVRGDDPGVRIGGGPFPALRLPAVLVVLVRARAWPAERAGARRGAIYAGRNRLLEQLLRPPGVEAPRRARAAAPPDRRHAGR